MKARKARKRDDSYPMPNSSQFVFPMIVAPDAFSRRTTVASKGDWKSFGRMAYAKKKKNQHGNLNIAGRAGGQAFRRAYLEAWQRSTSWAYF